MLQNNAMCHCNNINQREVIYSLYYERELSIK